MTGSAERTIMANGPTSQIEVRDLHFAVSGQAILNGIDLTLARGERLAIIGPNGSGKSTLLRCLYAWWKPTGGVVLLDGADLTDLPPTARARKIAVLAQESEGGLGLTVEEVVTLGRLPHRVGWAPETAEDRAAIDAALNLLELGPFRTRAFSGLSGGEKQRALFARALAQKPSLLILDEPTNHLDIRHQLELLHIAAGLGIGVIATLHDINLAARWSDRLCLMQHGRIRALGHCEAVLTAELLSEVYGVEVDLDRDPRTGSLRFNPHLGSRP
jgi:iron complex transport system ATP-binding protein